MLGEIASHSFFASQATWVLWLVFVGSLGLLVLDADKTVSAPPSAWPAAAPIITEVARIFTALAFGPHRAAVRDLFGVRW